MAFCPSCGTQAAEGSAFCAECGAALGPQTAMIDAGQGGLPTASAAVGVVYAGFFRRWLAMIVDGLILGIPIGIVAAVVALGAAGDKDDETAGLLIQGVYYLLYWLVAPFYYALQESSAAQATLGKRALGIKVTDLMGKRISFGQAIGRWFAAALSYLTLYIGFLMAGFTERKQALHDMLAGTLVVDKYAYTDQPQLQKPGLSGCLIAILIAIFLFIPVTAILAAIAIPAYQQYRVRSEAAAGMAQAAAIKPLVAQHWAKTGECPGNGSAGIGQPGDYAGAQVASILTGAMQTGGKCAIEVTFGDTATGALKGQRLWLVFDPERGSWACDSELPAQDLPSQCRQ